ncbi:4-(cytidine 5'-diphospho)-2-C-methyl-D-erythritol kinase [Mangrovactinospora gilvigrisea]|uniref:4-diphosphocytidyl-2-C-methyl-D-erythritol kinase n=1 Tax=Mangrovactinospora gilvigrisea TaxID=1428644 RepID=A0A1J7C8V4_9ACTN|nr:4-(cytidine 5'-diphospho)-2-C-methyl-D-erythritol kinase [Mangrovactinospora gilvigrisea]OIV37968.1 4-(cytidine 5'-diphospho)-2-C-methyl-D-erythritol kinase [Mangrovactinospora gilvigrisea]
MSHPHNPKRPRRVTARTPAKVNVQLAVGGLRDDQFHDLANVFMAVDLHDTVTVEPAEELLVTVSGRDAHEVPADASNLAAQAAWLLGERYHRDPYVHIHIEKNIPVAGGMAGGSADGAAALLAIDALWETKASRSALLELAARMGSDVPFALYGGIALGRGRGELLTPIKPDDGGEREYHWVFALAEGGLSTPAVFHECDRLRMASGGGHLSADVPMPDPAPELLAAIRGGDTVGLGRMLAFGLNDLQEAALSLRPELRATLDAGTAAGALAGLVSGSGPTCAFLAAGEEEAVQVAKALRESGMCRDAIATRGPVPGASVEVVE